MTYFKVNVFETLEIGAYVSAEDEDDALLVMARVLGASQHPEWLQHYLSRIQSYEVTVSRIKLTTGEAQPVELADIPRVAQA